MKETVFDGKPYEEYTIEEVIAGLEDLAENARSFFHPEPDELDEQFRKDERILRAAIAVLSMVTYKTIGIAKEARK